LRSVSSSVLSLLLVMTLMWGGCVSCPQFFMFPKAAKSCCNKSGECERPTKTAPVKECKKMPLESQGLISAHAEAALAILTGESMLAAPVMDAGYRAFHAGMLLVEHPPPDLNILHSSFII